MISIENVNQQYGGTQILWDLTLSITPGSCHCIVGRNGVGKTTLLNCIMGLLRISSGTIKYNTQDISQKSAEFRARNAIGYVPQGREIFSQLTVEENLRVGLACRKDNAKHIPDRIYELFPVLEKLLSRRGGDLSGGQQQQLAIARALVIEPQLLILDEPNEGIQPNIVKQIGDVIEKLNREDGLTVILVEQKLAFARRVGEYFHLMDRGRIVANGVMAELNDSLINKYLAV